MLGASPPLDPVELARRFREGYVNFFLLWKRSAPPPGVVIQTPEEAPISASDLPAPVRDLLTAKSKALAGEGAHFYKYMRIEDGVLVRVVEDERGLPDQEDLLTVSQTATLLTGSEAHVVTEVFVAYRHPRR